MPTQVKESKTAQFLTQNYPKNFDSLPSPCYVLEEEKFEKICNYFKRCNKIAEQKFY